MIRGNVANLDFLGIFSTYPNPHISVAKAFLLETVITAILLCLILALTDDDGIPLGPLAPLLISILIAVIGASMVPLTGLTLNFESDFGPKTFAFLAGLGKSLLYRRQRNSLFFIPLIATVGGAYLGAFGYRALIGPHLPCQFSRKKRPMTSPVPKAAPRAPNPKPDFLC